MSDTPRTDAAWEWKTLTGDGLKRARLESENLERELATAEQRIDDLLTGKVLAETKGN